MNKKIISEIIGNWEILVLTEDLALIHRNFSPILNYLDIAGKYWALAVLDNTQKSLWFSSQNKKITLPATKVLMSVPPFSIYNLSTTLPYNAKILVSLNCPSVFLPNFPACFECLKEFEIEDILDASFSLASLFDEPINISTEKNESGIARKIKKILDQEFRNSTTLGDIAKTLKLSSHHLTRYFKQGYGITPSEYLRSLRITTAAILMIFEDKGKSIINVASCSGYNDLSRFNKQFKSRLGFTPSRLKL